MLNQTMYLAKQFVKEHYVSGLCSLSVIAFLPAAKTYKMAL